MCWQEFCWCWKGIMDEEESGGKLTRGVGGRRGMGLVWKRWDGNGEVG
jgi:hypothetical protein